MQIRPRGQIRSHRLLERKLFAPWIVVTLSTIVVVAAVSTGFYFLIREPCSGKLTATITTPSGTSTVLEKAARSWANDKPVVNGLCAAVNIEEKESPNMLEALATPAWNTKSGTQPDGWVPESSIWVRKAAANGAIARVLPDKYAPLARGMSVIAMPRPMAEALGWPNVKLTWTTLVTDLAASNWGKYNKSQWGSVRIMMTDPTKITAGMLALLGIANLDSSGNPSAAGLAAVQRLKQIAPAATDSTESILAELTKADRQGVDAVCTYVSAFPALEADIISYNLGNPTVPLVGIYPTDGGVDADNPGVVLRAGWADPARQKVTESFFTYLRGKGKQAFLEVGFRSDSRAAGKVITDRAGLVPKVSTAVRTAPSAEVLAKVLATWTG